jgi:hypothetical protein
MHGIGTFWLHAINQHLRCQYFHRCGNARSEATTTDGHDDGFQIRALLQKLQRYGRSTQCRSSPLEGMQQGASFFFGNTSHPLETSVDIRRGDHFAAISPHTCHAQRARAGRHDDLGVRARLARGKRRSDGMVTGTDGSDATSFLLRTQQVGIQQGATRLEASRALEQLQFQGKAGAYR